MTLSNHHRSEQTPPLTPEHTAKRIWPWQSPFLKRSGSWIKWGILCIVLLAAVLGPSYLSLYDLTLGITLFLYIAMAQSWNLLGGYGGLFSLGHSLFVGAGSYTLAVLLLHSNISIYLALLLSGLLASFIGASAAIPLLRLRDVYFSVGSLGITMAGLTWMINWSYTGATSGLNLPPTATLDYSTLYYLALGLLVLTMVCIVLLVRSSFGLRLMAIRDDEDAAAELGVSSFPVKLTTFAISAFFIGIAGALLALKNLSIEPNSAFNVNWVITMIIITVIGGLSTSTGPLIGAIVVFALQQSLQGYDNLSSLLTGVLLILIIRLAPDGIWKTLTNGFQRLADITFKLHTANQQEE